MKMEMTVDRKPWEDLCSAIAEQAIGDYKMMLRNKEMNRENPPRCSEEELKKFFLSDWFYALTHLDGQSVLSALNA